MAFKKLGTTPRYIAESGDSKSTTNIELGSTLWEIDTNKMFMFDGSSWNEKKQQDIITELEIIQDNISDVGAFVLDEGTATSGDTTTLTDTSKNFEVDVWADAIIVVEINGTEYIRTIDSNTSDTITVSSAFDEAVSASDTYKIRKVVDEVTSASIEAKLDTLIAGLVETS
jgi:hypothetical protein